MLSLSFLTRVIFADPFSPSLQPLPHHTPHTSHPSISLGNAGPPPHSNSAAGPPTGPNGPSGSSASSHPTPKLPSTPYTGSGPGQSQQPPTPVSGVPPPSVLSSGGPGSNPAGPSGSSSSLPPPPSANGLPPSTPSISLPPPPSSLPPQPSSSSAGQQQQQPPLSAGGNGGQSLGRPPSPGNGDVTMSDGYAGGSSGGVDFSDIHSVPPEYKKEGSDWFAVFNPQGGKKKALDVQLVHTLMHERCVRFVL